MTEHQHPNHHHHHHVGCSHHHHTPPVHSRIIPKTRLFLLAGLVALAAILVVFLPALNAHLAHALLWVQEQQKLFREVLGSDLRAVAETHSLAATLSIVLVGFLYGIFHAVGPGHGKILVTGYLLAGRHTLWRGIVVSGLSSLLQSITAIVLVLGLYEVLGLARQQTENAAAWLEVAGYGFMALVGLALLLRGVREAWHLRTGEHAHHHEGCNHGINPQTVAATSDKRSLTLMIVSIGIRPCTGAILLLVFACIVGAVWAGVLAMGVGTFITTATLAILAVQSKKGLLKLFGASEKLMHVIHAVLGIIAGGLIVMIAGLFLVASIPQGGASTLPHHPLLQRKVP
jgi:nickel/cobalt transporter (NicO) family protein